jgi:protein-S-isoprenylcysteine O-methyltransferase Ste14
MSIITPPNERLDRPGALAAWRDFQTTKLYDLLAAVPVIVVFGASGAHLARSLWSDLLAADPSSLDLPFAIGLLRQAVAMTLIVLLMTFLLLRNPAKAKARGPMPRLAAFAGTYLAVALAWLPKQEIGLELSLVSLMMMFAGVGFSVYSILHLGRSFSLMAEARRLVTDGPYAYIRHPLYLGEAVSLIGFSLQFISPLALAIVAVQVSFQLVRMKNEEGVLEGLFPEYGAYKGRTARLIPGVY